MGNRRETGNRRAEGELPHKHTRGLRWRYLVGALGVVLAMTFVACGGDDDSAETTGDATAGQASTDETTAEAAPQIALLTTGTQNDGNWGQAFTIGSEAASEVLGAELTVVDNLNDPPEYAQQGAALGRDGYAMVLMALGTLQEVQLDLADQFPDTLWCAFGEPIPDPPANVCFIDPLQQEPAFLGGVAAGLITESNVIGSVNGFDFPQITRQPEGFALGARCVNPDVEMVQELINSFTDSGLAKAATEGLASQGADVILAPLATATQGVYAGARDAGIYAIPEYLDSNEAAPETVLTTVLFDLQGMAEDIFTRGVNGELDPGQGLQYALGDLPDAGLAPFYEDEEVVGEENLAVIDEIKQKILDGEITIPTTTELGTVGSGSEIDPASIGC